MLASYSESSLIEKPAIGLFSSLGWKIINAYEETYGPEGTLGRDNRGEMVLVSRLKAAMEKQRSGWRE